MPCWLVGFVGLLVLAFGLSWTDFFRGLPVTVDLEKDLSLKKQLLDVIIIRKEAGTLDCRLPDGFEELAKYNLVSFKSHQEKRAFPLRSAWRVYPWMTSSRPSLPKSGRRSNSG